MCLYPVKIITKNKDGERRPVTVKCGKCVECLRQKSVEWAFRILDECSLYSQNSFLTLTYNDEHIPPGGSVSRRELQLFIKRLRQEISPVRIRFFGCGEYGKKFGRPHYHLIIFGWYPADAWFFKHVDGSDLYRSPTLEKVWRYGFSSVAAVDYYSALYTAKYMNKIDFDNFKKNNRGQSAPVSAPFIQMSNRPGIGYECVYQSDLRSDRIYKNGRSCKIPRYYLKVMERDGLFLDEFKERRQRDGSLKASFVDLVAKRERAYEYMTKKTIVLKRP